MIPGPSIPRPSVSLEARRSLYRVLGKGGLLFGLVVAFAMTGVDPTPATPATPIVVTLGIQEDVRLRSLIFVSGLATALLGFVAWRRSGGEFDR